MTADLLSADERRECEALLPPLPAYDFNFQGCQFNAYSRRAMHEYGLEALHRAAPASTLECCPKGVAEGCLVCAECEAASRVRRDIFDACQAAPLKVIDGQNVLMIPQDTLYEWQRRLTPAAAPSAGAGGEYQHPDNVAVDLFATAMKAKLSSKRAEGYGGWDDPLDCPADRLRGFLAAHLAKGDPVDVGNFAMMLFNRGESTTPPTPEPAPKAGEIPAGFCLVDRAAVQLAVNALYRDAEAGRAVRGEIAEVLSKGIALSESDEWRISEAEESAEPKAGALVGVVAEMREFAASKFTDARIALHAAQDAAMAWASRIEAADPKGGEPVAYRWWRDGVPVGGWIDGVPSQRQFEAQAQVGHLAKWTVEYAYARPQSPPRGEVSREVIHNNELPRPPHRSERNWPRDDE